MAPNLFVTAFTKTPAEGLTSITYVDDGKEVTKDISEATTIETLKEATVTANGTTAIEPGEGYDAMKEVSVTVAVPDVVLHCYADESDHVAYAQTEIAESGSAKLLLGLAAGALSEQTVSVTFDDTGDADTITFTVSDVEYTLTRTSASDITLEV